MTRFFRHNYPPKSPANFPADEVYVLDIYDRDEFPWRITDEVNERMVKNYAESIFQYDSGSDDEPGPNDSIHRRHTRRAKGGTKNSERQFSVVLFGCNDQGQSVAIHCIRNTAHMYVGPFSEKMSDATCVQKIESIINAQIPQKYAQHFSCKVESHVDFVGINPEKKYVRIDCRSLKCFYKVKYMKWRNTGLKTYESNLDPQIKFIHSVPKKSANTDAKGIFWVRTTNMEPVKTKLTRCDLEFWCETSKLDVIEERVTVGKFLFMSFDIESYTEDWRFKDNKRFEEYVFMISAIFKYYGDNTTTNGSLSGVRGDSSVLRLCLVFDDRHTGPDEVIRKFKDNNEEYDVHVVYVKNRATLLTKFFDVFRDMSPEMWSGYNIFGYDLNMIVACAEKYGVWQYCSMSGKMLNKAAYIYHDSLRSSGIGEFKIAFPDFKGTIPIDMYVAARSGFEKFTSYKLDYIAKIKLGLQKKDISYSQMFWYYWLGKTDDIVEYNDYDSYLNWKIFDVFKIAINNIALCNLCGVPLRTKYLRGKCYGIHGKIISYSKKSNMIVPDIKKHGEGDDDESYSGGTVLNAKKGYYGPKPPPENPPPDWEPNDDDEYTIVLDFTSLFPSVKIANNFGHDTIYDGVPPADQLHNYTMYEVPINEVVHKVYVAKKSFKKSVLVDLLISMLKKRKEYQAEIERVKKITPVDNALLVALDSLQNEAKMFNNSEYGTTGSKVSTLAHPFLGPLVTMMAGRSLMKAIEIVSAFFQERGDDFDIIYGDTDSVFIKTYGRVLKKGPHRPRDYTPEERARVEKVRDHPEMTPQKIAHILNAVALGNEMTERINQYYRDNDQEDMGIKYEKVYDRISLHSKKRYIGTKFEMSPIMKEIEVRGLETKRRETSPYAKKMLEQCHRDVFNGRNYMDTMEKFVRELENAPIEDLVMTKNVKSNDSYKVSIPAHGVLAAKMNERDPTTAPQINERISYIYQKLPFQYVTRFSANDPSAKKILLKSELVGKIDRQYMVIRRENNGGAAKIFEGQLYSVAEIDTAVVPQRWNDVITRIEDPTFAKQNEIPVDYVMFMEKEMLVRIARTIKQNERENPVAAFDRFIDKLGIRQLYKLTDAYGVFKDKPAAKKPVKKRT